MWVPSTGMGNNKASSRHHRSPMNGPMPGINEISQSVPQRLQAVVMALCYPSELDGKTTLLNHRTWGHQTSTDMDPSPLLPNLHRDRRCHACYRGEKSGRKLHPAVNLRTYNETWPGKICPVV